MSLLGCFYTFMTALFTSLIIVPFLRRWALDQGNLDIPDERKMHDTPMPRLGGIAIFLSFLLAIIVFAPLTPVTRGFLAGGLIVFITGLVDDLTELSSRHKFAGQTAACLAAIVIGKLWLTDLGNLFGFGDIILPVWFAIPFTVFAMVGVINAINLIDGLDGLAGGVSIIALTAFFILGWFDSNPQIVYISVALAGGILGFLKYNFYPARIFMGDAGSLTVGFILGFLAVLTAQHHGSTVSPMAPILILAVPLFDTVWVMSRRILAGESPFAADRTHLHHKFLNLGFEHRLTVIIIYGLTLFWACSAIVFRTMPDFLLLIFLLGTAALFYIALRHILRNPDLFVFVKRDDQVSIRASKTYERISAVIDRTVFVLIYLLIGFFLLALWSTVAHNTLHWQVAPILLVAGIYLWYKPLRENRQFLMLILYVTGAMAALEVWHAEEVVLGNFSLKRLGDSVLAIAGLIVILKVLFRRPGEFFLTSADYLTLAVCVFLSIASQQNALGFNLNGPLFRSIVVVFVVRTLCSRKLPYYKIVAAVCFAFLAVVSVLGFVV